MGMNDTPSGERVHIGFFGKRNAGKSTLVNAVTGQQLSVVSDVAGTTTDPVKKAMELLPLGPVVIVDTPGLDDVGKLGEERVRRAKIELAHIDVAVLVIDGLLGRTADDDAIERMIRERAIPYLVVETKKEPLDVAALKDRIAALAKNSEAEKPLVSDIVRAGDNVVLVVPIDKAAPKGRLILPQQQVIRDLLDAGCLVSVCRDSELAATLAALKSPPALVITDSQVFGKVDAILPRSIPLTSFSIIFARYKGDLKSLVAGAEALAALKDGDRVLISEGCTHHRQCGDIGAEKMPRWIGAYTNGARLEYAWTSGGEFPDDLAGVKVVVHCGGCMLNAKEMRRRMAICKAAGVPMVNYGVAIAQMHGILPRALEPFAEARR